MKSIDSWFATLSSDQQTIVMERLLEYGFTPEVPTPTDPQHAKIDAAVSVARATCGDNLTAIAMNIGWRTNRDTDYHIETQNRKIAESIARIDTSNNDIN